MSAPAFPIPPIADDIAARLKAGKRFFFCTHVYPDGDNLGSMLALMHALTRMGKECRAHVGTKIPEFYTFIPGALDWITLEPPADPPSAYDGVIIVDSGDITRMGEKFTAWYAQGGCPLFNIDHHISNTLFGDVVWVDAKYAAVGEQIFEILGRLGVEIDEVIGRCLMTSMMTDTGRFSFENTSIKTMEYATDLVRRGISTFSVFEPVYQSKKLSGLKLQTLAMQTLVVDAKRGLATFFLTQPMLEQSTALLEESEGLIDIVNAIDEIKIVCFFKEANPGDVKVSIRAKAPIDGALIAQEFGGGGHARAAGASVPGANAPEAIALCLPRIQANLDRQRAGK